MNNVLSAEHFHHMNQGSGAHWLVMWFDACAGQMFNWVECQYHCHITDPDMDMHMYARLDAKIPEKGHTYLECDRGFGEVQRESKGVKTIADMYQWMDIAKACNVDGPPALLTCPLQDSNRKHPPLVTEFTQDMHYDWQKFLSQFYVRGRTDIEDLKVLLRGSKWRSYGASEELIKGENGEPDRVELVSHPGEVWLRYSHDDTEPWTKVDLRRTWICPKKDRHAYARDDDGWLANVSSEVRLQHACMDAMACATE